MDLLLTHGYFLGEDPKELAVMKPYAPLGILYLSAHLRAKGFEVEIFDTTFRSRQDLLAILDAGPPSVIGIYGNLMTRRTVLELTGHARAAGWTIVLGGPEPSTYAREYLEAGAHIIVQGEGEMTLGELLPALRAGGEAALERVNGIIFRRADGSMAHTPPRALVADLDSLPWPDRERVDI